MTDTEIPVGTPAWFERRERLWNEKAARLVRKLKRYEEDHPKEAVCLSRAMDEAHDAVADPAHTAAEAMSNELLRRFVTSLDRALVNNTGDDLALAIEALRDGYAQNLQVTRGTT